MAAGWIKMRVDLHAHPKVVRISSALTADRLRVVGALLVVWSVFDAHTETGRLEGYTLDAMDSVIGWPGFCAAMRDAGWLTDDNGQAIEMPDFERHNGESAKRRAMEAERKRSARTSADRTDSVRKMSAATADKKRTREEKRREENIQTEEARPAPLPFTSEQFTEAWANWEKHRSEIKKPIKPTMREAQLAELAAMGEARAIAALRFTIAKGWQGIREPDALQKGQFPNQNPNYGTKCELAFFPQ